MKRLMKWMTVGFLFLFLVLAGLGVWLRHQYPPDRLRRMAAEALGAKLGRQIDIADAQIGLWHGLELKGLRISEFPTFSSGNFIQVENVRIQPRWIPLLSRKIMVRSIDVDRPSVTIRRSTEGTFNFADLTALPPGAKTAPGATAAPTLFLISRATLSEGEILFQDDGNSLLIHMRNLDARVSGFSLTNPFGLQLEGDLEIRHKTSHWNGPLAVHAHLNPTGEKTVTLEKVHLGLGASSLDLTGTLSPLPTPHATVTLALPSLVVADLAPLFPLPDPIKNARLAGQWTIHATTTSLEANGTFDAQDSHLGMTGTLTLKTDGLLHTLRLLPKSFRLEDFSLAPGVSGSGPLDGQWDIRVSSRQWTLKGELIGDRTVFSYENWLKKPASAPLTLTGSVTKTGLKGPMIDLDLRAPEMDISPNGPWPRDLQLSGTVGLTAEVKGTPDRMAFDVSVDGQSLQTAYGTSFRKKRAGVLTLSATGELRDQKDVNLSHASIHTEAGTLGIQGQVIDLPEARSVDLTIHGKITDLSRVGDLLPSLADVGLRGQSNFEATAVGPAVGPTVIGQIFLSNASATPIQGLDLSKMNGQIDFGKDTAVIKSLQGSAFGSPFTLTGKIDHFDRPTIDLEGRWDRLEIEKLLKAFSTTAPPSKPISSPPAKGARSGAPPTEVRGRAAAPGNNSPGIPPAPVAAAMGNFRIGEIVHPHYLGRDFQFKWNLTNVGTNLSLLSGDASVTAASGEIKNIPVAKKINKLMDRDDSTIAYKKLAGTFSVTQGRTDVQSFVLNSDQTDFSARGHVRLGDLESDLRLMLKLPPGSVRGSVGHWMTAEDGRPTIEASLKGPLGDPKVKVDYRDTVRRAAKDLLNKTLGGWKGKPDRPSPVTAPKESSPESEVAPDTDVQKELEEMGRRSLEKIFRK